jgi:hypothetical protein
VGSAPRYVRYLAVAALSALFAFALYTTLTSRGGVAGIAPGHRLPPFAAPLAVGGARGEVNVATQAHDGPAGDRPACSVRGPGILNVCEIYERRPLVLALFINASSCPNVVRSLARLAPAYPQIGFAAVGIRAQGAQLARFVRRLVPPFPVGIDREGRLGALYRLESCAQVTFVRKGGVVQGPPLLEQPSLAALRSRLNELAGTVA